MSSPLPARPEPFDSPLILSLSKDEQLAQDVRVEGRARISVVTPTLRRTAEVRELLANLARQTVLPYEVLLVDGAPADDRATEQAVAETAGSLPFRCRHVRHSGGTAIQRNAGIDRAEGEFVAFIDDDIRLEPDFFAAMLAVFRGDAERRVGGVVGYRTNQHFTATTAERWRWYRRLHLLKTFQPGRYDFACGYPINANMQPPFEGVKDVDFMTTSCAVWRREVMDAGLRFDPFFRDYGMLEDAHFSLIAGRTWRLLQCGDAHCQHLHSQSSRTDPRTIGAKCVVNYYYVFNQVARPLSLGQKLRFWRFQLFELFRVGASGVRRRRASDFREVRGRLEGMLAVARRGGAWS
jgi:glycosyltransferase involved in cell wall biosynthesis